MHLILALFIPYGALLLLAGAMAVQAVILDVATQARLTLTED